VTATTVLPGVGVPSVASGRRRLVRRCSNGSGGLPSRDVAHVDPAQLASGGEVPHDGDGHADALARVILVHRFYRPGGEARVPSATICPLGVRRGHGKVCLCIHTRANAALGICCPLHRDGAFGRVAAVTWGGTSHRPDFTWICAHQAPFETR
jgi:hypothetical protein